MPPATGRFLALAVCLITALAAGEPLPPFPDASVDGPNHHPRSYKPWSFPDCDNLLREPFLPADRLWERIDVWSPKTGGPRLPCVVFIYGGGYGGKVAGFAKEARAFIDQGYVVAMPDYVLQAAFPVPITVWDVTAAIRWLRSNAARLRIDPARIGVVGWSAGGWIAQYLAPSDAGSREVTWIRNPKQPTRFIPSLGVPMIDPHPAQPGIPIRVQAAVSDWNAGRLSDDNRCQKSGAGGRENWLSPDDTPVLTCIEGDAEIFSGGMKLLKELGVPMEVAALPGVRGVHCPPWSWPSTNGTGPQTTWQGRILQFMDRQVKNPTEATPPEAYPCSVGIAAPTAVTLLTVHDNGRIHYTLDGSEPTAASARANGPVTVAPGQTLKTRCIVDGLAPSRVLTATYPKASAAAPVITTKIRSFTIRKGEPFSTTFTAESTLPVRWSISGKPPGKWARKGPQSALPGGQDGLAFDAATGVLSGTPLQAGSYPCIIVANAKDGDDLLLLDAIQVTILISE